MVVRATSSRDDLSFSTFVYNGGHGRDAQGSNKGGGARGRDTIIHVPVGTTVKEVHRVRRARACLKDSAPCFVVLYSLACVLNVARAGSVGSPFHVPWPPMPLAHIIADIHDQRNGC